MLVFVVVAVVLLVIAVGWTVLPLARGPITAAVATIVIMSAALGLYVYYGTPAGLLLPTANQPTDPLINPLADLLADPLTDPPTVDGGVTNVESIEQILASVRARLSGSPDDVEAWLLLGRSYAVLDRLDDALDLYRQAHAAVGDHPDLLADWVEVEARLHDNLFTPAGAQRLQDILVQEPTHNKALWLGGFAALQAGDKPLALERWRTLLAQQPPDSDLARLVTQLITQINSPPAAIATETTDNTNTTNTNTDNTNATDANTETTDNTNVTDAIENAPAN